MYVDRAYAHCEHITRTRAANFYYGIRLLLPAKRRALCAVYALARRIDDIGDGALGDDDKLAALQTIRSSLARINIASADPVLCSIANASTLFPIPISAFEDLVDGVEMDVRSTPYETFDDLILYCRRVAGSMGRLSLAVFGSRYPDLAEQRAESLGVALQITNILRDLREDHARGRVYIPRADLQRFGCQIDPSEPLSHNLVAVISFETERAREWFARGSSLLPLLEGRSFSCAAAMAGIYRRILMRIEKNPGLVLQTRIGIPIWEKAWVAAWSVMGRAA